MRIYVASSWRNPYQPEVVRTLREIGHEVYDFRNPREGNHGFQWSEIDRDWQSWNVETYICALNHPVANKGFALDYDAMEWSECGVMVMPCGRSAHLEAGYFNGAKKPLIIYLSEKAEPELMYKMADNIVTNLEDLRLATRIAANLLGEKK